MDARQLYETYLHMSDEQLLQLAGEEEQLTFEAQAALRGEMARRGLEPHPEPAEEETSEIEEAPPPLAQEPTANEWAQAKRELMPPAEAAPSSLLAFWEWNFILECGVIALAAIALVLWVISRW